MNWKKTGTNLFYPPIAVLLILFPVSTAGMLLTMLKLGDRHPVTIAFYVLAFYDLAIWCLRMREIVQFFKNFKKRNRYTSLWFGNYRLRMNVTLTGNILWNGAYGVLQLGLGIYHHSAWFYSLAAYYACLATMRFLFVRHTLHHEPGKAQKREFTYYCICGWVFLLLNLALSCMMFYMIRENRVTRHHEITTIAMAAYTFLTLIMAVVNIFRYRKMGSPVISAARAVSLTAACVSMLSLENTMLVTFGDGSMSARTRQMFLAISGTAISVFVVVMAVYMIVNAHRKLKSLEN